MSRDFDGSADNLNVDAAPVTSEPLTMACWFRSDDATGAQTMMFLGDLSESARYFALDARGETAGDPIRARSRFVAVGSADTSTGYSADTWHHAAGVFTSTTSRAAFIDGGSKGTDTTSVTPSGVDRVRIGALGDVSPALFFNGEIAEAGIWNAALSDDEIVSLAGGISPLMVRPGNLVGYWPIFGVDSPEPDYSGTNNLTVTGAVVADHSPTALMLPPPTGWQGAFTAGFTPRSYPRGADRGLMRGVA